MNTGKPITPEAAKALEEIATTLRTIAPKCAMLAANRGFHGNVQSILSSVHNLVVSAEQGLKEARKRQDHFCPVLPQKAEPVFTDVCSGDAPRTDRATSIVA